MPRVALAPVFLTWFGFGITSKIVMAATICFFPVLVNTILGMQGVSQDARALMRSFGASKWEEYRKLLLPSSLPAIFASLKVAITLALIGAIVAEFLGRFGGHGRPASGVQLPAADRGELRGARRPLAHRAVFTGSPRSSSRG